MTLQDDTPLELTVVMPCLNEADTLATCVRKALAHHGAVVAGEVVVADNGSTDDSQAIARAEGARLVPVADRGYGAALMGGIDARAASSSWATPTTATTSASCRSSSNGCAKGPTSCRVPPSLAAARAQGAMPPLHRWFGNPMFSRFARRWFRARPRHLLRPARFTKTLYKLDQRCTGMGSRRDDHQGQPLGREDQRGADHAAPDGRKSHPPHLNTFRDGWRTPLLPHAPRRLFHCQASFSSSSALPDTRWRCRV